MASILQFGFGVGAVGIYTQSGGTAWCSQLRLGNNNGSGSQGLVYLAGGTLALTGYSVDDLKAGVPLVEAVGTGTLQVPGLIPVTLDGASHRYWWAKMSNDGKTLTAAFIPMGTMIRLL